MGIGSIKQNIINNIQNNLDIKSIRKIPVSYTHLDCFIFPGVAIVANPFGIR